MNQDLPLMEMFRTVPQTSPGMNQLIRNCLKSLPTETIRGVRSFMGWHQIPESDIASSTDDNPFHCSRVRPTRKVSVKLSVDDWLCRKRRS